jgi:thiol-disulfide isomerase/thioredoxin
MFINTLTLILLAVGTPSGEGPFASLTYKQALISAANENKPLLIDFFAEWCGPCKRLDRTTWIDRAVIAWMAKEVIAIKVDADIDQDLCREFGVSLLPTVVFISPSGNELGRIAGYISPTDFLVDAQDILAGKVPPTRKDREAIDYEALKRARDEFVRDENDPRRRRRFAIALEAVGRYGEALEHYLWCWDEGMKNNGTSVVVLTSFLIGDLVRISRKLPVAKEEMRDRRAMLASVLLSGSATSRERWDAAVALVALDSKFFNAPEQSIEFYDTVVDSCGEQSPSATLLRENLTAHLARAGRYREALLVPVSFVARIQKAASEVQSLPAAGSVSDAQAAVMNPERERQIVVEKAVLYFEVYAGAGQDADALLVADAALGISGKVEVFIALLERAKKTKSFALGRELLLRAEDLLEPKLLPTVEKAAQWAL